MSVGAEAIPGAAGQRIRRRVTTAAGGVLAACTFAGCIADDPDPPVGDGIVGESIDVDRLRRATVGVRAAGCSLVDQLGTGVTIGDARTVVTSAHTVSGATSIRVVTVDGFEIAGRLIAFDPDRDLAVIRAEAPVAADAGLGVADVSLGSATVVSWDREDGIVSADVEVTRRLAITIEDIYVEETVRRSGLEVSGEIVVGDSGAPVIDRAGDVIGIVYAASRDRNAVGFAVDRSEIDAVLDDAASAIGADESSANIETGRCI